jgi:hypothetical protein
MDNSDSYNNELLVRLRDPSNSGAGCKALVLEAAEEIMRLHGEIGWLRGQLVSLRGPESEAVKLLRRCHDAGDLVTPLDETLRDDVATFFGGKDG